MLTKQERMWLELANNHVQHNAHVIDKMNWEDNQQYDAHVVMWIKSWNNPLYYNYLCYDYKGTKIFVDLRDTEALLRA